VAIDARQLWELGIGTYVRNLIGGLARAGAGELDLTLVMPPPPWPDEWIDPVAAAQGFPGVKGGGENTPPATAGRAPRRIEALTARASKHSLVQQWVIPARMLGRRLHLFHAPHYVLPLAVPVPVIVTVHDVTHLLFPEFLTPAKRRVARLLLAAAVNRARRIIAVSRCTAADLEQLFPHVREKLRIVYPGLAPGYLDGGQISGDMNAMRAFQAARRLPERYILYVGALRPHKNLSILARAYAQSRLGPGLGLVLAGEAPARYAHLPPALAAEAGPGVQLLGRVPQPDLPLLYAGATAVALPSLYEGFGFTAVEAMASGVPVVVSTAGALPEVVGDAGLLVPPLDLEGWRTALVRLAEDAGLRAVLAAQGRSRAAEFGLERLGRETLEVYQEALAC
jgi:glycosyltransferase involved in cell wall biosynthesis